MGIEALYTYKAPSDLEVGDAVLVPLGGRVLLGFVVAIDDRTEAQLGFPVSALKPPQSRVAGLNLPPSSIELARYVSRDVLCSLSNALSPGLPPGAKDRLQTVWRLVRTPGLNDSLKPVEQEVVRVLQDSGGEWTETKKPEASSIPRTLQALRKAGWVDREVRLQWSSQSSRKVALFRLSSDDAKIESFLHKEGKRRPAQSLVLMTLLAAQRPTLSAAELKAMAGVTETSIRALVQAGLLETVTADGEPMGEAPHPNPAQQLAIDAITDSVQARRSDGFLLFGVTGSGKTEVYLQAAAEALKAGRQVLYLVPEIALAAQAIHQLRRRFGSTVAIIHSELAAAERLENWMRIRRGEASIIVGARSAIFAPASNVGLIIMDEEHEAAYKQESSPRYHSKRLATFLSQLHQAPVVFGSATPSIESYFSAEAREAGGEGLILLNLPHRTASAKLPEVKIADLTQVFKGGQPSLFVQELQDAMAQRLEAKEQTILFLNRRAYASFLICRDCGHQFMCPNCAVSLSYHRKETRLRCHHCDYAEAVPDACPVCEGTRLKPFGVGTEKVEEAVKAMFPEARVARLDRDVARRKGALEQTLAAFRGEDLDILVGTQMVAKGLDFPNVTLVGVIAADISLNLPDFRSSERTFQLLSQVAGRAGRGTKPGEVIIQTFNPEHPAVLLAQHHDYVGFFESINEERKGALYPPYSRLINIVVSGESRPRVDLRSKEIGERCREVLQTGGLLQVLGPVDCVLERVQNRWRRHLLLKLAPTCPLDRIQTAIGEEVDDKVQVVIDVDPYSLM